MKSPIEMVISAWTNGEPVFVLRGKDELAVEALEYYVELCYKHDLDPEYIKDLNRIVEEFKDFEDTRLPD